MNIRISTIYKIVIPYRHNPSNDGYANVMTIPPNVRYQDRFLKAYRQAREGIMGRTRMLVIIVSFSLLLCFTVSVERKDE